MITLSDKNDSSATTAMRHLIAKELLLSHQNPRRLDTTHELVHREIDSIFVEMIPWIDIHIDIRSSGRVVPKGPGVEFVQSGCDGQVVVENAGDVGGGAKAAD